MSLFLDLVRVSSVFSDEDLVKFAELVEKYRSGFEAISHNLYDRLSPLEQQRFVTWFLKRWGKIDIIDKQERQAYDDVVARSHAEHGQEMIAGSKYLLRRYDDAGYDFSLLGYDWFSGVHDIHFDQYATSRFDVRPGDIIIDAGAFIGVTAVLFNAKTKGNCEVHAFEPLDENIALMQRNLELNGLAGKVHVNRLALAQESGQELSIGITGLQASTSLMHAGDFKVNTITLDDYVKNRGLKRVDFIKFDIEGETPALEGARETIEKFRPRMALCLSHKWDDVLTIPKFLNSLSFSYDYEFKWVQLKLGTEAVILLTPKSGSSSVAQAKDNAAQDVEPAIKRILEAYHQKSSRLRELSSIRFEEIRKEGDAIVVLLGAEQIQTDQDRLLLIKRGADTQIALPLVRNAHQVMAVLPEVGAPLVGRWDVWLQVIRDGKVIAQHRVLGSNSSGLRYFFNERIGDHGASAYLTDSAASLALYVDEALRHEQVCADEIARIDFPRYLRDLPLREDLVFFESFLGKAYAGNPRYIYEMLLKVRPDLNFVWAYHGNAVIPGNPQIVRRGSPEYMQLLAQAKYRVNNIRFPVCGKKDETIYLQTWHGTPLKRLSYDIQVDGPEVQARDALYQESRHWSLLLSENPYSSEVLPRAFRYSGRVLEAGYPLTDVLAVPCTDRAERLEALGLPNDRRFILYAPTWRDDKAIAAWQHRFDLNLDLQIVAKGLPKDCMLLIKAHHLVSEKLDSLSLPDNVRDMSHVEDVNDLCVLADALVTDYSSVFFDFAVTGKPILFYCYDLDDYAASTRGLYLDMERDLPGPVVRTTEGLVRHLANLESVARQYLDRYATFQKRFCSFNDGGASRRVVEEVFGKETGVF